MADLKLVMDFLVRAKRVAGDLPGAGFVLGAADHAAQINAVGVGTDMDRGRQIGGGQRRP